MPGSPSNLVFDPDQDDGYKLQSYFCQCYRYLEAIIPFYMQASGIACQADLDVRLQMWSACNSQKGLLDRKLDIKTISKAREFLKNEGYEPRLGGYENIGTILKQDLVEMSQTISAMIASVTQDAILTLTDKNLLFAMDVLQTLVDGKYENYGQLQKCLLRITRKRGLLPLYLLLPNVQKATTYPLRGGGFADVYRGEYLKKAVALKVLRVGDQDVMTGIDEEDSSKGHHRLFCKEAMIWRQFNHPNILPLYGVSKELFKPWFCLVSPWMENGDLNAYLRNHGQVDRLRMVIPIAEGLQYLHSFGNGIVHGDLRGANILIDRGGVPRLADFGLTQIVIGPQSSRLQSLSSRAGGAAHWQAPEMLSFEPDQDPEALVIATTESDVYSFACVCMEVFTGKPPFANLREARVITAVAILGHLPSRPSDFAVVQRGLDDVMWNIMLSCWQKQPENRPPMSQVLNALHFKPMPFPEVDAMITGDGGRDSLSDIPEA